MTLASHVQPGLSLFERLTIKLLTPWCFVRALSRSIRLYPFYKGHWPWKRLFVVSLLRAKRIFTDRQRKATTPTTGSTIITWARDNGIEHRQERVVVDGHPDIILHELHINEDNGKSLFYVHGGGFVNAIAPTHLPLTLALLRSMKGSKIYIPEYSLAPAHPYPAAFVQVVTALASVLSTTSPDKIVLAGDSAGGCLVASTLAHLLHPSPLVDPISLSSPLAAAILICPYITFHRSLSTAPPSFTTNAAIDFVTRAADERFQRLYAPVQGDVYAEPGVADGPFWKGLGDVVGKVQVTAGEWELIRDDALTFGKKMQGAEGNGRVVEVQVAEKAVHVEPVPDFGAGIEDGALLRLLNNFCATL